MIIYLLVKPSGGNSPTSTKTPSEWSQLAGNVWAGVKVYNGEGSKKSLSFTVVGGNDNCSFGRGLLVQYENGDLEWKDRDAIILNDYLFVHSSDPAITLMHWEIYPCP